LARPLCLDCHGHAHHVVWNGWAGPSRVHKRGLRNLSRKANCMPDSRDRRGSYSSGPSCFATILLIFAILLLVALILRY